MIKFRCSACAHKIAVPQDYAGKYVKCPSCGVGTLVDPDRLEVNVSGSQAAAMLAAMRPAAAAGVAAGKAGARSGVAEAAVAVASVRRPSLTRQHEGTRSSAAAAAVAPPPPPAPPPVRPAAKTVEPPTLALLDFDEPEPAPTPTPTTAAKPFVPKATPPRYLLLQVYAGLLVALAACVLLGSLIAAVLVLVSTDDPGPALVAALVPLVSSAVGALGMLGMAAVVLAVRDSARNSFAIREAVALLRSGHS